MSVSSVVSNTTPSSLQGLYQQGRSAFKTMLSDVQFGDMSGAQSALSALQQAASGIQGLGGSAATGVASRWQNSFDNLIASIQAAGSTAGAGATTGTTAAITATTVTTGASGASSSLGQDLTALIQAVQSGNLSGAQQDLTQLETDAQNQLGQFGQVAHHHHHHHGDANPSVTGAGGTTNINSSSVSAYASITTVQMSGSSLSTTA